MKHHTHIVDNHTPFFYFFNLIILPETCFPWYLRELISDGLKTIGFMHNDGSQISVLMLIAHCAVNLSHVLKGNDLALFWAVFEGSRSEIIMHDSRLEIVLLKCKRYVQIQLHVHMFFMLFMSFEDYFFHLTVSSKFKNHD